MSDDSSGGEPEGTPPEPMAEGPPGGDGPRRARRWWRSWKLWAGLLLVVVLVVGAGVVWLLRQIDPPGGPGEEVVVEIPQGTSAARIAELLEGEGVITSARIFRLYTRVTGAGEFKAGAYERGELRERMAMGDVVDTLVAGPVVEHTTLTIPEGFTLEQIAARVDELPGMEGERFRELATSGAVPSSFRPDGVETLEGLLFPDTYRVAEGETEEDLLRRMVGQFEAVAEEVGLRAGAAEVGVGPYEAIVLASLIEEETKIPSERPLVSAVIHNRLERGMLLQIDATVLYALGEHKDRVLYRDLEVDSPYNTYRYEGLPPTPIAAPGAESLAAAVDPAAEPYLYYVVIGEDGRHAFAETVAEHERNKAEAERRGVR